MLTRFFGVFAALFITTASCCAQTCNTTRSCAQAAVDAALRAEAAVTALTQRIAKLGIQCEVQKTSGTGHYPVVVAEIPKEKRSAYVLTGGSCSMNSYPALPHNGTMLDSHSLDDRSGWYCRAGDPPNIPLGITVTAEVIFCKIGG